MHQQASGPNNAQMGGDVINSKIKIRQEYHVADNTQRFVKLEVDPCTVQQYLKSDIEQKALRGSIVVAIPFAVTFIGLFADWLEILAPLELGKFGTILISLMLGIMLATVVSIIEQKNISD
jgi:hypothetical protein